MRSENCGLPAGPRHTISPSSTASLAFRHAPSDWQNARRDLANVALARDQAAGAAFQIGQRAEAVILQLEQPVRGVEGSAEFRPGRRDHLGDSQRQPV
jgi:hypothetical protein